MPELIFLGCIFLFFIFPVPALAVTLGAGTCLYLYRRHILFRNQPQQGKKLLGLHLATQLINLILSVALSLSVASLAYLLIYRSFFLFMFNVVFCSIIAARWFDFSWNVFRRQVNKMRNNPPAPSPSSHFAMIYGLRPGRRWGLGMSPASLDAGMVTREGTRLKFKGVYSELIFDPANLLEIEKISSEKIRLVPAPQKGSMGSEAFLLVLRERFYPFKSQDVRDHLYSTLAVFQSFEKPGVSPSSLNPPLKPLRLN